MNDNGILNSRPIHTLKVPVKTRLGMDNPAHNGKRSWEAHDKHPTA